MYISHQQLISDFINQARALGLPHIMRGLGPNSLLICEPAFQKQLETATGTLRCLVESDQNIARLEVADNIHTIILLLKNDEFHHWQDLAQRFPKKRIVSTQYQIMPHGVITPGKFPRKKPPVALDKGAPIILLSPTYSDAEYLVRLMEINGMPVLHEFFGRSFIPMLQYVTGFRPLQYYRAIATENSAKHSKYLHLQSDALRALTTCGALSLPQLRQLINLSGARVIHFTHSDKIRRAANQALLIKNPARSVWTIPPGRRKQFLNTKNVPAHLAFQALKNNEQDEACLDQLLVGLNQVHTISLDDLINAPEQQLQFLANFIEHQVPTKFSPLNYNSQYQSIVETCLQKFRRETSDQIGLHSALLP